MGKTFFLSGLYNSHYAMRTSSVFGL